MPFQIDHVIAEQHHGATVPENLALPCLNDNLHKGPNIAGLDPPTGLLTRLFHPRQDECTIFPAGLAAPVEGKSWIKTRLSG